MWYHQILTVISKINLVLLYTRKGYMLRQPTCQGDGNQNATLWVWADLIALKGNFWRTDRSRWRSHRGTREWREGIMWAAPCTKVFTRKGEASSLCKPEPIFEHWGPGVDSIPGRKIKDGICAMENLLRWIFLALHHAKYTFQVSWKVLWEVDFLALRSL